MQKIRVVWGVRGHPRSSETLPFDRVHMTSYSTLIEIVSILYRFRVIACFSSKVANSVIVTQRSCAGNQRFCNLISRVKDVINMEEI